MLARQVDAFSGARGSLGGNRQPGQLDHLVERPSSFAPAGRNERRHLLLLPLVATVP
jgi:hypothetical protein